MKNIYPPENPSVTGFNVAKISEKLKLESGLS
jgi:hypothetical protein